MKTWSRIGQKLINKNPWYSFCKDYTLMHNKEYGEYFYVHTLGSSIIIGETNDQKLVFVKQYRYLVDHYLSQELAFTIELPCGGLKEGQSHVEAALAELHEETGYTPSSITEIGQFIPYNGVSTELCKVFLAQGLEKKMQILDISEQIEVLHMSQEKIQEMISSGEIIDGMTLAALNVFEKFKLKQQ